MWTGKIFAYIKNIHTYTHTHRRSERTRSDTWTLEKFTLYIFAGCSVKRENDKNLWVNRRQPHDYSKKQK